MENIFERQNKESNINKNTNDLTNVNSEFFGQFEWNIKLKSECQECIDIIILLLKSEGNTSNIEALKVHLNRQFGNKCSPLKEKIEKVDKISKFKYPIIETNIELSETNSNKLIKELNISINLIENTNPMMNYFEELKRIGKEKDKIAKQKERRNEIINLMKDLVNNNFISEFNERLENKIDFLVNNSGKILLHQENYNEECLNKSFFEMHILPEEKHIKKYFKNSGHLYVGYCLVKRIENTFTNNGKVKFSEFLSNGVGQEYGLELKEALGQIRLDMK